MGDSGPHGNLGVEVLGVAEVTRHEGDHYVGMAALGADESLGVRFPPVELLEPPAVVITVGTMRQGGTA
jgi:hypothetical protein